ncbi:hypothetical protein BAE44_0007099 [Dichanthelium oligosanthes]|uniref:Uncharacterized protein n=1 Tax=Dichanthelium oligosanthes TaxID=888268 RepID=A0A1E5W392_9POAL|nr:hypothetical protein BAE44_0007099 [Dichanthelium oligosanthes]
MLDLLKPLKAAGLTGVKVMWTFFERRIQPLMARAHAMYRYTGVRDPTRMSPEVMTPGEMRSRVWAVIKRPKDNQDLDRHERGQAPYPAARHAKNDPAMLLRAKAHYPPLPEDDDKRAANRAENERQRELSRQKKKRKAEKAVRHMRWAQKGSPSEESEEEDDDEDEDGEVAGDGEDDDDDDDDDMGARYAEALGLGKHSAREAAKDPNAKRFRADPGQSSSGAAPRSGRPSGESSSAPSPAEGILRGSEAAPVVEENLPPPPEVLPPPAAVSQAPSSGVVMMPPAAVAPWPTAPPAPATAPLALPSEHVGAKPSAGGDPWGLLWVLRTSRAPRRASSTTAVGASGPADAAGMEPAATQRADAASLDEARTARAASQAVAKVAEPSSGPATKLTEVADPTEVTSEEEGAAAEWDAAADEEVEETDQSWSEAPLEGAARGDGAQDVPRVGVPEATAAASVTPTVAASVGTSSMPAHAMATVGAPVPPSTEVVALGTTDTATVASGRTEPSAASLEERPAAAGAARDIGWDADASGSGSDDDLVWQEERSGTVLFRLQPRLEEEERIRLQLAVKNLNDALAEVGNCHQRQSEHDAAKMVFLRDHLAPYYQRTEDMRGHRRAAERRLEAVELKLKEAEAEVGQL